MLPADKYLLGLAAVVVGVIVVADFFAEPKSAAHQASVAPTQIPATANPALATGIPSSAWRPPELSAGPASSATYPPIGAGYPAWSRSSVGEPEDEAELEGRRQDIEDAKSDYENATSDLRQAVRGLGYNDWSYQMGTIGRKLRDADDALSRLEELNPNDPGVQAARSEVDRMRSDMRRLDFENWRSVAPSLDRGSRGIENSVFDLSDDYEH